MKLKRSVLFITCTNFFFMAHAQKFEKLQDSIAEVVISENRLQIPFSKRSRDIQIINNEDIKRLPVKSINEVLAYANGMDIRQRGPFGTQADISIDGGSFEQALILINGVKISDPQTGHHTMNIPIAMDAVERIEILRGPMARVYGANALTGAINIVTRKDVKSGLSAHIQLGSSFEKKEEGDGKGRYGAGGMQVVGQLVEQNHQHLFSVSSQKSNGQRYNSQTEDIRTYYQGSYQLQDEHSLEWAAGYINNAFGANGYYAYPGDRESYEIVKTFFTYVASKHYLGKRFYLSPRISNRFNKDDYRYYRQDLSKARSEHKNNAFAVELNSRFTTDFGDLGIGVEYRDEQVNSNNLGKHFRSNIGTYLEYRTQLFSKVGLHLGAYGNYNTDYGWQIYPGMDMGFPLNKDWKLNVNVGASQRIPSFTDLYLNQPMNKGNQQLNPESAWQYEASIQGKVAGLRLEGRYFYREITDFIDWIKQAHTPGEDLTDIPFQPYNFGSNKVHGYSIDLRKDFIFSTDQQLNLVVGYNHLNPKEMSYQEDVHSKYVLESLKHQVLFRLSYRRSNWTFSSANRWIERELNNPYFISDLHLGYRYGKLDYYVEMSNLANAQYVESGAVLMPKRWFAVGARFSL
ncbi:TonB-dependent receptor plug domain-containing protein [Sphingobacterium thermophilum]|uniref:Outer membrane cobalamin translocator n=1 Tax=Sphingobacterium thermophilum TaxID=768534 RepID=A0ABP8QXR7_9SPHI